MRYDRLALALAAAMSLTCFAPVCALAQGPGDALMQAEEAASEAAVQDLDIAIDGAIGQLGDIFVEEAKSKTE